MPHTVTRRLTVARSWSIGLTLVVAAGAAPGVASAQSGRALAVEDYYRMKYVGSPEISPDGRWVAFTVGMRIETTNGETNEVWLVPSDGASAPRRVSAEGTDANTPTWSDDGMLRFAAGGKGWQLDPSAPDRLTETAMPAGRGGRGGGRGGLAGGGGRMSIPSPDARWTAVVRNIPVQKREIAFASDFEKRHEERFKGVQFDWLDFQRDGQPFPVPNRVDPEINPAQEIYLTPNGGGGNEQQITRLGLRPNGVEWNRDGSALVFTADSSYRDERKYGSS
jgi:dipeptidyl aminopeptidase/acylaminoacyl peptidase